MKKCFNFGLMLLVMLWADSLSGQIYEVGVTGGISAYRGDLNREKIFNKIYPAGGVMLRYSHNQHISARLNMAYSILRGSDLRDRQPYVIIGSDREYKFETALIEASLQAEVNFLPFTTGDLDTRFTPYIFGGFGGIYYDPQAFSGANTSGPSEILSQNVLMPGENYDNLSIIGLFGFGFKFNLTEDFLFGVEWGMRSADTDYLDVVSLKANPRDNDWYSIVGATFTYKFLDRSSPPCPLHLF